MYYVYIDTSEVHYSFVMKVYVFCPAQMVGVLYIYTMEKILSVLRHMKTNLFAQGTERFFKKQLSNLKVKI